MAAVQPLTVVCIEDDLDLGRLIKLALGTLPVVVHVACNGVRGMELIHHHQPRLILLDLELPGMNGWEIYKAIQSDSSLRHIAIVVITANTRQPPFTDDLPQLAAYVVKPFTLDQLRAILQSILVFNENTPPGD